MAGLTASGRAGTTLHKTLLKADRGSVNVDPTEDFRQANKFYVLTDKQEYVHIMSGNQILHSFGNLWLSKNAVVFKGSSIYYFYPVSDVLTDICGRLKGESIVKTSLRGTYSAFYVKRLLVSTSVLRTFETQNTRDLQPIVTKLCPWTGWGRFIGSPSMDSSVDFCSVTGEGQKTSSVLSRALSRIEMRFRQRQSDCLTEVGVNRKSYCP